MFKDDVNISNILYSFESILRIDYEQLEIDKIVNNSILKLENAYATKFDMPLYELQIKNRFINSSLTELVQQLEAATKDMALCLQLSLFHKTFSATLQEVSYLGFNRNELLKALKYLQDVDYYGEHTSFFYKIVQSMDSVQLCTVKKLFIIMIILEKLDVQEAVSVIASYLYAGGVLVG